MLFDKWCLPQTFFLCVLSTADVFPACNVYCQHFSNKFLFSSSYFQPLFTANILLQVLFTTNFFLRVLLIVNVFFMSFFFLLSFDKIFLASDLHLYHHLVVRWYHSQKTYVTIFCRLKGWEPFIWCLHSLCWKFQWLS